MDVLLGLLFEAGGLRVEEDEASGQRLITGLNGPSSTGH